MRRRTRFRGFADAGVNRLSLGVQSLEDDALAFLGRNHDAPPRRSAPTETAARPVPDASRST
jgi:coproporphyrinogen III oxidase-like Fe-S oxidoreductase